MNSENQKADFEAARNFLGGDRRWLVRVGTYYMLAFMAYARGWAYNIGVLKHFFPSNQETCTTGLNGRHEARDMYLKHGWKPYCYKRISGCSGYSRTFITGDKT